MIYTYLLIGLILAGVPTYLDLKEGVKYSVIDWLYPIGGCLFWPAMLLWIWYKEVVKG